MSAFDELVTAHPLRISKSILARTVDGDRITLAVFELDPGSVIAEHSHENEQLGMVIRGSLASRVASEVRELGPGGTWRIPPNTPHEVHTGPERSGSNTTLAIAGESLRPPCSTKVSRTMRRCSAIRSP